MSAPSEARKPADNEHLQFVGRIFRMRLLGLGAGCVAVGGVLYQQHAAWPWWALLAFDGYVWPFIAYLVARHSRNPIQVERRSLVADSMAGGMWIAVMQLNLLGDDLLVFTDAGSGRTSVLYRRKDGNYGLIETAGASGGGGSGGR